MLSWHPVQVANRKYDLVLAAYRKGYQMVTSKALGIFKTYKNPETYQHYLKPKQILALALIYLLHLSTW